MPPLAVAVHVTVVPGACGAALSEDNTTLCTVPEPDGVGPDVAVGAGSVAGAPLILSA